MRDTWAVGHIVLLKSYMEVIIQECFATDVSWTFYMGFTGAFVTY